MSIPYKLKKINENLSNNKEKKGGVHLKSREQLDTKSLAE